MELSATTYSFVEYDADAVEDTFAFTFPSLRQADIHVYYDGVETTAFTFGTYSTTSGGTIVTNAVQADGVVVTIRRETEIDDAEIDFADGAVITEADLDNNTNQMLFAAQEAWDRLTQLNTYVNSLSFASGNLVTPTGLDNHILLSDDGAWVLTGPVGARAGLGLGTAAVLDTGTAAGQLPKNSDLGDASLLDTGTAAGELPTNGDLPTFGDVVTKDVGVSTGEVPILVGVGAGHGFSALAGDNLTGVLHEIAYIKASDVKATTVEGGGATLGSWFERTLNDLEDPDSLTGVALASDTLTLPAGTYEFRVSVPGYGVGSHQARLKVDSTYYYGTSEITSTTYSQTRSFISGKFTISVPKDVNVEQRVQATVGTYGLGKANGFGGDEIYTVAEFWRIS